MIFPDKYPIGLVHCVAYGILGDFSSRHFVSLFAGENRLGHLSVSSHFCAFDCGQNSWEFPVLVAVWKKPCRTCRLVSTLLTPQTLNKTVASLQDSVSVPVVLAVN